jgi:hypothetical protein
MDCFLPSNHRALLPLGAPIELELIAEVRFHDYLAQRQQVPSLTFRQHLRAVGGAIEE